MEHLYPAYATEKLLLLSINQVNHGCGVLRYTYPNLKMEVEGCTDPKIMEYMDILDLNMNKLEFEVGKINAWFKNHDPVIDDRSKKFIKELNKQETIILEMNELIDKVHSMLPEETNKVIGE